VLPHQFGQDLILALDLLLQALDPFLFGPVVGPRLGLEGRRPVVEELLLPAVEDGGLQPQLVTELGDRSCSSKWRLRMATFSSAV
jgi:hypothetical protein